MNIKEGENEMKELILTIGLPRSGKTTWARTQGFPIVNPDSIRLAFHGEFFIPAAEPMVWCIAKYMVKALFLAGHNKIIVDATNTTKERRDFWKSDYWRCVYHYINTPTSICIQRAIETNREELIPIIKELSEKIDWK
ncbi:hypothetical protein LCGC14_0666490 [marine sediment metagenome]|uniref:Uncharacterized protein n=1 Tax=marine sediment metagenome TaxID=412755 RepID=A0A0F9U0A8_9ZZZZ|nr:hypothetical protein [archaeon]